MDLKRELRAAAGKAKRLPARVIRFGAAKLPTNSPLRKTAKKLATTLLPGIVAKAKQAPVVGNREPIVGAEKVLWVAARNVQEPYLAPEKEPYRILGAPLASAVRVAMIADDFTYQSFRTEFDVERLMPKTWRAQMDKHKPALFFCESAWQGGPPSEHPWQSKVYASIRWPERRHELLAILAYCKKKGIPTVFWNKEDPTHFDDRVNDFVATAKLFDHVLTTDADCVSRYVNEVGVAHAGCLPFAVQPRIFHPLGAKHDPSQASFAGSWYANYEDRSAAAEEIFDLVLESGRELVIYDRAHGTTDERRVFPAKYAQFTHPAITFEETAEAYRASAFGITLNTVTTSSTMFARRIYELAACGAIVLSNESEGVRDVFGDSVIFPQTERERFLALDDAEILRMRRKAMSIAMANTYLQRAEQVLAFAGVPFQSRETTTLAVRVASFADVDRARELAADPLYSHLLLIVEPEAEYELLDALQRKSSGGETVVAASSIAFGLRSRSYMTTPDLVLVDLADPLPAETAAEIRRHLVHADAPVRACSDAVRLYTKAEGPATNLAIGTSSLERFGEILAADSVEAWEV